MKHQIAPFARKEWEVPSRWWSLLRTDSGNLLSFLHFSFACAFAQLLLGLQRGGRGHSRRVMVVVVLRSTQRRAKQQEANPGLHKGEGGAMRVTSSHYHLRGDGTSQEEQPFVNMRAILLVMETVFYYFSIKAKVYLNK